MSDTEDRIRATEIGKAFARYESALCRDLIGNGRTDEATERSRDAFLRMLAELVRK